MLTALEPGFDSVVVTRNSSPRSMSVDDIAEIALSIFGDDRVFASPNLEEALDVAVGLVDDVAEWGSAAVVALGSVVTAADARKMMRPRAPRIPDDARELTIDLLPEDDESIDDSTTDLVKGLGIVLPGFEPQDEELDEDLDEDLADDDEDDFDEDDSPHSGGKP